MLTKLLASIAGQFFKQMFEGLAQWWRERQLKESGKVEARGEVSADTVKRVKKGKENAAKIRSTSDATRIARRRLRRKSKRD